MNNTRVSRFQFFRANHRTFPFRIASVTMASNDYRSPVVSLTFLHDNRRPRYR